MEKFHEISTDSYAPVSFKDKYLFKNYEQVANFLALHLNKNYKSILSEPIHKNHMVEWRSPFSDLKDVRNNKELSDRAYFKYYEFLEDIQLKISEFSRSSDEDKRSWAGMLEAIFNENDNIVFSNGDEISIIWGWKFNNNEIYKPDISAHTDPLVIEPIFTEPMAPPIPDSGEDDEGDVSEELEPLEYPEEPGLPKELEEEEIEILIIEEEDEYIEEPEKKAGFLEFLKWFASKYWWLLIVLLILIALIFTAKSLKYS